MNVSLARRLFIASAIGLSSVASLAQGYPDKPVQILVGFSAGGPTDVVARLFAEGLSQRLKRPFVVENVNGANGDIAAALMMKKPADGHTVMWAASAQTVFGPIMRKKPRFDPVKDWSLIAMTSGFGFIAVVSPKLPVQDMRSFVEYARKNPGKLSFSSSGTGGPNHLLGERLNMVAGLDLTHVPYKGDAQAVIDLVAGNVSIHFLSPNVALPLIGAGKLKALAVTTPARQAMFGDVPTMRESGFDDLTVELFNGLVARDGTPPEIVRTLNAEINEVLKDQELVARLATLGTYPIGGTPSQFQQQVEQQTKLWRGIVQRANIPQSD
ncbi:MAG: tripartite tricarboxylate transporter substrate binding protein [Variovorax sp.]